MHSRGYLRVVLDSSPLIVLAKLGLLESITKVFNDTEVPQGVLEEISKKKNEVYAGIIKLIRQGKIRIENVKKKLPRLGLGESSAIFLALMKGKIVVLDDKKARKLARELGLEVIGTLSILKKLHNEGLLKDTPNTLYRRLIEIGFYIDKQIFDKIFKEF